jgi:hypothetical protein
MRIARRFNAGMPAKGTSPEWTVENYSEIFRFSRPFGTQILRDHVPGVETPGYSRNVPPGQHSPYSD